MNQLLIINPGRRHVKSASVITSPARAVAKYCDEHVCVSVCLSVCPPRYIQRHARDLYQIFSVHVRYLLSPVCLSVRLSVTLVHPTQAVVNFGNFSTAFGTLAIHWHTQKILWRSSQGNPSVGGVKPKKGTVAKYSDCEPIEGYISETVQDTRQSYY